MKFNKYIYFKALIFFIIITSFFVGFILKGFAPSGADDFHVRTWPLLQSFKNDFLFSIVNYGKFEEGSYPLFYIINAYLNPFSSSKIEFLFSATFISFIVFILYALLLKKNLSEISWLDCLLTSSIILLLPFYRSSAYWGSTANFGWLFFVLSLYFFFKIKNYLDNNTEFEIVSVIAFCFLSSCALYIRPALVFLPILYFLYLFLNNKNKKIIISSVAFYFIFSIPGFIVIYIWGGIYDTQNWGYSFTVEYHHYQFILKNIPILLSYFTFYFFPILIIECLDIGFKKVLFKYMKVFSVAFIILIFLWQFNYLDYLGKFTFGGGAILKLNYLLKLENFILLLISAALGFAMLYEILKENFKINISILLPIFVIYGFPRFLFQGYLEPLILFIFFSGLLNTKLHQTYFKNIFVSNLITSLYFAFYLLGSTYYKHFI